MLDIDMLDDFAAVKVDAKKQEVSSAPAQPAAASVSEEPVLSEDDFAKQLQAGMADLLGELDNSVSGKSLYGERAPLTVPKPEMQAQFESIFKELGAAASESAEQPSAAPAPAPAGPGGSSSTPANAEASFQETIKRTMERMQAGGDQATAAAAAEGSDDFMAELLKQMQSGGGLDGEGNEEEFSKMLMGMMEQLTNKEILYEPMKELNEKFPGWMETNRDKVSEEDLKKYEEQQTLVKEIVLKFEEPTFSDSNATDREYVIERMQKVSQTDPLSRWLGPNHSDRCKLLDHRRQTSSGTCPQPRMRSACRMSRAIRNRGCRAEKKSNGLQFWLGYLYLKHSNSNPMTQFEATHSNAPYT